MCVIEDKKLLQKISEFEDTEKKKKKSQKTQEKKITQTPEMNKGD